MSRSEERPTTLTFPAEHSFGQLSIKVRWKGTQWLEWCEAKGQIIKPANKDLALQIAYGITDFSPLADLAAEALDVLDFNNTKASDSDLRYIRHLTHLQGLALWETNLGDEALKHISHFAQLRWLDLGDTKISDEGLRLLSGLLSLRQLSLPNTEVGDQGVNYLVALSGLEHLDLMNTRVSDVSVGRLIELALLQHLRIYGTGITEQGYEGIRAALPRCNIWYHRSNDLVENSF